ncbi:response regulator [Opitutus terrae]|uniref:Response regulator receiver protein n=1 Tax=Opitutus terrae (strain DSM 11246 / JCM 15787 / PB90-1) TaxID=452637 RepID=B1ZQQ3_OPITP|nr:response regulator transcription factor [Opitutus terrae]ACB77804.1 response regulator receiver protein [Opitutus terrae PB90-1]
MPAPIRVLIADDHDSLREGLSILLEFEEDIQVVAEARDGREAVEQALIHRPDVVVMDITMPRLDGLQATRQIRQMLLETHVLMISAEDDNTGVEQAIACGALGFICKHTSLMNVPNAIREVDAGNTFFAMTPRRATDTDSESESVVEHVEF